MSERIVAFLVHFVTSVIDAGGYAGIAALMAIESACIPLPSEIIMPFAGALIALHFDSTGQLVSPGRFGGGNELLGLLFVATAGAIGCNLGSLVAYWIGAIGGRPLVERYGRWVLMSRHDLDRMTRFFEKYGSITVLLGRLLPVVRTFIAFPAGIARMPQGRFHLYTFIGSWPWCFALAYAGMRLGESWNDPNSKFHELFHRFHTAIIVLILVALVWFVWTHIQRARKENRPDAIN
jgi:membrane protein DedA with SNARE-associated domain